MIGRVFANSPGDMGSIPGRVILKILKMVLDTSLLNTQYYKVRIKGKVEQSRERSNALPPPRCSSYSKGSLQVTLDSRETTLLFLYFTHSKKSLFINDFHVLYFTHLKTAFSGH